MKNQAGHCSEYFKIYRGCRQGDPIYSCTFILCVELLPSRIRSNEQIKRITINYHNIVMSQFADDTSIILMEVKDHAWKQYQNLENVQV